MLNTKRGFGTIGIIIIVLLALGVGAYLWSQKSLPPNVPADNSFKTLPAPIASTPTPIPISSAPQADVNPPVSATKIITVVYPNGGETWRLGIEQTIRWTTDLSNQTSKVAIILRPYPFAKSNRAYLITREADNNGIFGWKVENSQGIPEVPVIKIPAGSYTLGVCILGTDACDSSDLPFSIK